MVKIEFETKIFIVQWSHVQVQQPAISRERRVDVSKRSLLRKSRKSVGWMLMSGRMRVYSGEVNTSVLLALLLSTLLLFFVSIWYVV